ncbi:alpha-isopropylmalate synthase regulatory domain-containing protein [Halalkalicoccus sp. NIPERK01]|nr:alpha-isopropylmalate synthase regulatory domain-containing protein [Halalkalicoccus sp. NIPERK01]
MDSVDLLDTTLRDGEQAPGISLSPEEKAEIARALDAASVPYIEAGSACTGEGERRTISRVTDLGLDATVTSFARGVRGDVDLALDCGVDGVNLVVPSSDRHIEGKIGTTREGVLERTLELVDYAKDHGLWVEVIGEDGSRADLEYLVELLGSALDAGADRVCYADTVGHAGPGEAFEAASKLTQLGPTSTHTHDDLGLGMANALASVAAGADLVHATVNGVGERAGNVALEEVAIALDHSYGVETVDTTRLYDLAGLVSRYTGVPLPPNKAVVGENAFAHESGIHTDGTLKDERMYESYSPEKVGRERRLVLGKHTGRAGARAALEEHDVEVSEDLLQEVVSRVKRLADRGKRVTDADLLAIAEDVRGDERDRRVELLDLTAASGGATPTASVRLRVDSAVFSTADGSSGRRPREYEERVASGLGSGPVDAAVSAVRQALGSAADAQLDSYHVDAITGGTDAVVTVEVTMSRGDRTVTVARSDADITRASVVAMVDALDRLLVGRTPTPPADD